MSSHFAAAFFLVKIAIRHIRGDKENFYKERKKNNEENQKKKGICRKNAGKDI